MPATEQQILTLAAEADALAQTIHAKNLELAETISAHEEANEEIQTRRAAKLAVVLNDRFELNHKLKYTNEDQRKVRLNEMELADADFQALKNARSALTATKAEQTAELEKNRSLHKSKLLVLQYYAALP